MTLTREQRMAASDSLSRAYANYLILDLSGDNDDKEEALIWLIFAANAGLAAAKEKLAQLGLSDMYVFEDLGANVHVLMRAVCDGQGVFLANLALHFQKAGTESVSGDAIVNAGAPSARYWIWRAIRQGDASRAIVLGDLVLAGKGGERNLVQAAGLFALASSFYASRRTEAKWAADLETQSNDKLTAVAARLQPSQRNEAAAWAQETAARYRLHPPHFCDGFIPPAVNPFVAPTAMAQGQAKPPPTQSPPAPATDSNTAQVIAIILSIITAIGIFVFMADALADGHRTYGRRRWFGQFLVSTLGVEGAAALMAVVLAAIAYSIFSDFLEKRINRK